MPSGIYAVTLHTGASGGSCDDKYAFMKFNDTTTAPTNVTYNEVYNGNFSTGEYNGWTITAKGFGREPMSIAKSDADGCYLSSPWAGYNGSYFATTFNCGLSNAPGNITSSPFIVNEPFLNFKIISPSDEGLYVEILHNNTPVVIGHYNTYNITKFGSTAPYTFRNASLPLLSLAGDSVRIEVVADTLHHHQYIAVTGFHMAPKPNEAEGILTNLTVN